MATQELKERNSRIKKEKRELMQELSHMRMKKEEAKLHDTKKKEKKETETHTTVKVRSWNHFYCRQQEVAGAAPDQK